MRAAKVSKAPGETGLKVAFEVRGLRKCKIKNNQLNRLATNQLGGSCIDSPSASPRLRLRLRRAQELALNFFTLVCKQKQRYADTAAFLVQPPLSRHTSANGSSRPANAPPRDADSGLLINVWLPFWEWKQKEVSRRLLMQHRCNKYKRGGVGGTCWTGGGGGGCLREEES